MNITVIGHGYELSAASISQQEYDDLQANGLTEDQREELMFDLDASGFVVGDVTIECDGQAVELPHVDLHDVAITFPRKGKCYIRYTDYWRGQNQAEIDGDFDPELLTVSERRYVTADGSPIATLQVVSYDGEEIETDSHSTKSESWELVDAEGQVSELSLAEGDSW